MQKEDLKKKFMLRRVVWSLFILVLFYQIWYGSWKNYFSTTVDIIIIGILIAIWIFGILKSGRDAEKYIEYQKVGGDKKYPYMKKGLKAKGWVNRFLAVTFIGESIIGIILLLFIIFVIFISLYMGVGSEQVFNLKFIGSIPVLIVGIVFFIWLGLRIWKKSKPLVKGKAPKY